MTRSVFRVATPILKQRVETLFYRRMYKPTALSVSTNSERFGHSKMMTTSAAAVEAFEEIYHLLFFI